MEPFAYGLLMAFWFGFLTSISPCPLTTNIAAVSFLARRVDKPRHVALAGVAYALGRSVVYVALGALILTGLQNAPGISSFLRTYVNQLLGPVLILVGLVLLGWLELGARGKQIGQGLGERVQGWGLLGAFALGILFALSFCPVSAGLFFGSLVTLAVKHDSVVWMPLLYGLGTAFPAMLFAMLIAQGSKALAAAFGKVVGFARWAAKATGAIFVVAGVYLSLIYVYELI